MFPCSRSCLVQRKNDVCSASYRVTVVVLVFVKVDLCFGCTSDKHGQGINILKCFAGP